MNRNIKIGGSIIIFYLIIIIIGPFVVPVDPNEINYEIIFKEPGFSHLMGTDYLGRDLFSRIITGTRTTISLAFLITLLNVLIGLTIGSVSGFFGGFFDTIIMRVVESLMTLPGFLIAICLLGIFGGGILNIIFFLILTGWCYLAKIIRNEVMVIKNQDFITSNIACGYTFARNIIYHIFPNILPSLIIIFVMLLIGEIFSIVSLNFLGLGVSAQIPELGHIIYDSRLFLLSYPWLIIFPSIFIFFIVFGLHLFADGLRDYFDKRKNLLGLNEITLLLRTKETILGD
jgi:ABC-type dipeptide/oligopeptide/nickel transport system permease subunit